MNSNWKISCFKPYEPGVFPIQNGVRFAAEFSGNEECGIIFYNIKGQTVKIPFSDEGRCGNLYGIQIEGESVFACSYQYYNGEHIITDRYAPVVTGLEKWGGGKTEKRIAAGRVENASFDWEGDSPLKIPYQDTIIYGLNVRAFTMHKSSKVRHRGTFEGIIEKIPYLKDLGITAVLLMPCYEYEECMEAPVAMNWSMPPTDSKAENVARLNCWGFQKGYYFAPKSSYSADSSPSRSFKMMVKELHQNGIEVMMHFYFPPDVRQIDILRIIKHWVKNYHIDGVRLSGFHIPLRMLSQEGFLCDTKIWCDNDSGEELDDCYKDSRNFAFNNRNFRNDIRRFLKGDEGFVSEVLAYQRCNPESYGIINYLADYDGFSLYDCVCYERKHNEANGEENQDGTDHNYTWNCGVEGESRKKSVQELRLKQEKNGLTLLFLSQGVPFLFSGDEFANTRHGNNNCYCQDNADGWVEWKQTDYAKELLTYTKFLIHLRKKYKILHMEQELKVMDTKSCGYPDISYHGIDAWRPDFGHISRIFGTMLCGWYAGEEPFFYIACNMHWEPHKLALPNLPYGQIWTKIAGTVHEYGENEKDAGIYPTEAVIEMKERSITVYRSMPLPWKPKKKGRKQ